MAHRLPLKTLIILSLFLALVLVGICQEEPLRILQLSTQVCLPCIGLG